MKREERENLVVRADLSNMTHSDIHSALSQRVIFLNPPHLVGIF